MEGNLKIRSFGRIKSRKLKDSKLEKLKVIFPKYRIEINDDKILNMPEGCEKLYFEIGFGYGEHTIHQALLNENYGIIACETYINGVLSLLDKIESQSVKNVRIYNGDARILLEKMPDNLIDKVFVLFPDPWPKKKQHKRRIINDEFLDTLRKKIKTNGTLFFASDILDYVESMSKTTIAKFEPLFENIEDCKKEPDWWIRTRYQQKAINEGRESYFLEFKNTLSLVPK